MINDGGPAYPCHEWHPNPLEDAGIAKQNVGLSIRDAFAMAAMQGIMAYEGTASDVEDDKQMGIATKDAIRAYHIADAMLAAREASNGQA